MTYREWFRATCYDFGLPEEKINVIMFNQDLNPDDEADKIKAKAALCREFASIIPLANVSEGGFSKSYNMEAINTWYRLNCASVGMKDITKPSVRNKSNIW